MARIQAPTPVGRRRNDRCFADALVSAVLGLSPTSDRRRETGSRAPPDRRSAAAPHRAAGARTRASKGSSRRCCDMVAFCDAIRAQDQFPPGRKLTSQKRVASRIFRREQRRAPRSAPRPPRSDRRAGRRLVTFSQWRLRSTPSDGLLSRSRSGMPLGSHRARLWTSPATAPDFSSFLPDAQRDWSMSPEYS
jgi:hypothetical protein